MKICVFCGQEKRDDEHVCRRCREYKGIEPAYRCPCGTVNSVNEDRCLDCGKTKPKGARR